MEKSAWTSRARRRGYVCGAFARRPKMCDTAQVFRACESALDNLYKCGRSQNRTERGLKCGHTAKLAQCLRLVLAKRECCVHVYATTTKKKTEISNDTVPGFSENVRACSNFSARRLFQAKRNEAQVRAGPRTQQRYSTSIIDCFTAASHASQPIDKCLNQCQSKATPTSISVPLPRAAQYIYMQCAHI